MQRGRPALSSRGVTLRRAGHYGQARNMVSSFQFWFSRSPLPALCRRATSCAWCSRLRKMPDRRSGCSCGHAEVRCGRHSLATLGVQTGVGRNRSGVLGRSWRPSWPKRRSKRTDGSGRGRAPNVTHSMVRRTCVPRTIGITVYFEHSVKKRKLVRKWGVPNVTHSVFPWT